MFFDADISDGTYTLIVTAVPDIPDTPGQVYDEGVQIRIDRTAPKILGVKMERTEQGCDVFITCDSDDLDYAVLSGSILLDLGFRDMYPFDDGYDHTDENGNFVYVVHESARPLLRPVVTVTDTSGREAKSGLYSPLVWLYRFFKNLPDRLMDRLLEWLVNSGYYFF